MTLPPNIADREIRKFVEDSEGNVGVRLGPNAIKDDDGNVLGLDKFSQARVLDERVLASVQCNSDLLRKILFQLESITGIET